MADESKGAATRYAREFKCTKHNLRFAFDDYPGVDYALFRCPVCAHEREAIKDALVEELTAHRNLLLKVIDLKQLIQPTGARNA